MIFHYNFNVSHFDGIFKYKFMEILSLLSPCDTLLCNFSVPRTQPLTHICLANWDAHKKEDSKLRKN